MKKEDFEFRIGKVGEKQYIHKENQKRREQLVGDMIAGKITKDFFEEEQRKMRSGIYLKVFFSESEYQEQLKSG